MRTLLLILSLPAVALAVGERIPETDLQIRCGFLNIGITNPPVAIRNGVVLSNPKNIRLPTSNDCPSLADAKRQWSDYIASRVANSAAGVTNSFRINPSK